MKRKNRTKINILIISIILLSLIIGIYIFGIQQTFFDFQYKKSITFLDYNATIYSDANFGEQSITKPISGTDYFATSYTIITNTNTNLFTKLAEQVISRYPDSGPSIIPYTSVIYVDLNLNNNTLEQLDLLVDYSSYVRCQNIFAGGGNSQIILESTPNIILFDGRTPLNQQGTPNPITQVGQIKLIKLYDNTYQLTTIEGNTQVITINENSKNNLIIQNNAQTSCYIHGKVVEISTTINKLNIIKKPIVEISSDEITNITNTIQDLIINSTNVSEVEVIIENIEDTSSQIEVITNLDIPQTDKEVLLNKVLEKLNTNDREIIIKELTKPKFNYLYIVIPIVLVFILLLIIFIKKV